MRFKPTIWCFILFVPPVQAVGSSMWCEPPRADPKTWAEESLEQGDTVILGRVYSVREIPQEESEPADTDGASTMSDLLRQIESGQQHAKTRFDHVVSFDVLRSWKEPILPIVRTKVYLGRLKKFRSFKEGEVYLVVGRDLEGTLYRIENPCVDAIWGEWSEKYTAALESLVPYN